MTTEDIRQKWSATALEDRVAKIDAADLSDQIPKGSWATPPVQQRVSRQKPMKRKPGAQHDMRGVDPARYLLTLVKPKLGKQKSGARGEKNERASNVLVKRKKKNV